MSIFQDRMIRAAKLDVNLYEEVEADKSAMGQAMGVVVLSSAAAGIASFSITGVGGVLMGTVAALISWYAWAFITYIICHKTPTRTSNFRRSRRAFAHNRLFECTGCDTDSRNYSRALLAGFHGCSSLDVSSHGYRSPPGSRL